MRAFLYDVLQRNEGQVLTRELIIGIAATMPESAQSQAIPVDLIPSETFEIAGQEFTIGAAYYGTVLDGLKELHRLHWEETESHRHELGFNMDYEAYLRLEHIGQLIVFCVWDAEGRLIGHCTMKVFKSMHSQVLSAEEDSLFLMKEYRGNGLARRLILFLEKYLRRLGVKEIEATTKAVNGAGRFLERLGYSHVGEVMYKMLGESSDV